MHCNKNILIILAALLVLLHTPVPALSQPTLRDANALIRDGWAALRAGYDFEARGGINKAVIAYQDAGRFSGKSLRIADFYGIPFKERPSSPYFLYGQASLALAQIYILQRRPMDQIFNELHQAENAFKDTIELVDSNTDHRNMRWAGKKADALFSLGTVFFLKGDIEQARNIMFEILNKFDRGYMPAIDTLTAIDYIQGRHQDPYTRTGKKLPARLEKNATKSRAMQYVVEIGKAAFGRWGTVLGMLVEDLFRER